MNPRQIHDFKNEYSSISGVKGMKFKDGMTVTLKGNETGFVKFRLESSVVRRNLVDFAQARAQFTRKHRQTKDR